MVLPAQAEVSTFSKGECFDLKIYPSRVKKVYIIQKKIREAVLRGNKVQNLGVMKQRICSQVRYMAQRQLFKERNAFNL